MVILMAVRRALGFVRFEAEGVFCERFLSMAAAEGVSISNAVKSGVRLRGSVLAKDYRRLRAPARRAGVRLRVIGRAGLPFWMRRHRSRAGLAVGALFFAAALFIMSRFIWEVRVSGYENTSANTILSLAEQSGLSAGTLRSSHDARAIEGAILTSEGSLAWVAVNLEGCVANILVKEATPLPEFHHDDDVPTNIVATHTGIIRHMEVYDGAAAVKVGDAVLEGSLLVSGIIEDEYKQLTLKHAGAKIFAEAEHTIVAEFPLKQSVEKPDGREINNREIEFFGIRIPLWKTAYNGRALRLEETSRVKFMWLPLQITVTNERIMPVKQDSITYSEEQAKGGAMQMLEEKEALELPDAEILSKKTFGKVEDGIYVLTAVYRCVMDIAKESPLLSETPWENTDSWS